MSKTFRELVTDARNRVCIRITFSLKPPNNFSQENTMNSSKPLIDKVDVCFAQLESTSSE